MARAGRSGSRAQRFGDLISDVDASLLRGPLSEAQIGDVREWAAKEAGDEVSLTHLVEHQSIRVDATPWHDHLSASPPLRDGLAGSGVITRYDVFEVAQESHRSQTWIPLLNASYAWGQGRNGYGPTRLTKIHDVAAQRNTDLSSPWRMRSVGCTRG